MKPPLEPTPALEKIIAFINTVNLEREDPLAGPDQLPAWCEGSDLCTPAALGDLDRLRAFREALRAVLEANSGSGDASQAWAGLEPFVREASYRMRSTEQGTPALEPAGEGSGRTIAALLAIAYDAIQQGNWARLKACRKDTCRWAYYDRSKNGSGAWCSMAVCGNRMKAKRRRLALTLKEKPQWALEIGRKNGP